MTLSFNKNYITVFGVITCPEPEPLYTVFFKDREANYVNKLNPNLIKSQNTLPAHFPTHCRNFVSQLFLS